MKFVMLFFVMMTIVGCSSKAPIEVPAPGIHEPAMLHDDGGAPNGSAAVPVAKQPVSRSSHSGIEKVPNFIATKSVDYAAKVEEDSGVRPEEGSIQLAVENMPVVDFIQYALSEVLQKNYTISEQVKKMRGTVMIDIPEPLTRSQFFDTLREVLKMQKIEITEENGMVLVDRLVSRHNREQKPLVENIGYGRKIGEGWSDPLQIAWIAPFNYVKPSTMNRIFDAVGLKDLDKVPLGNDELLLIGEVADVKAALEFINLIDRSKMGRKIPYLIALDHIEAEAFTTRLRDIFAMQGVEVAKKSDDPGIGLYPMNDLNAVYVIAEQYAWIEMIEYWKQKLDRIKEHSDVTHLFTYKARYRKADDLAEAINKLMGFVQMDANGSTSKRSGKPTIVSDEHTNTINMKISAREYNRLLPTLKALDILPLQVIIEVTLAEVTLTDDFQFGFEWFLNENGYTLSTQDGLGLGGSGMVGSVIKNSGRLGVALNAYSETKLLDILSKPRIVVLNNQSGNINVGTQVPIVTSESSASDIQTTTSSSILRNVSYRNTGVVVSVKPTVNSDGVLTMELDLSLSEAQTNNTSGIDSPLIVERSLTTSVVLESGDTIYVGGLISNNTSRSTQGVPWLEQIPLLGYLFKTDSDKITKTELVMLVRPTIVNSSDVIARETESFKKSLKRLLLD